MTTKPNSSAPASMIDDAIEGFRLVKAAHKRLKPVGAKAREVLASVDFTEDMRMEALLTLGRIGDPEAVEVLTQALTQFPNRVEPITALGHFGNSAPVPQLLKRFENPEEPFGDEIVKVLGQIGDPMATRQLLELLHSDDRMVRYHAAWALYKIGGRDVVQGLCRLLSDADEWIVINVLEILAQLKEPEAMPALVGQFEIVEDPRLKAIIISSLAAFAEPQLLGVFETALGSFDPRIQANAVEAVAALKISALEVRRKLKKFVNHPNNRVRANCAVALFAADPEGVLKEVLAMMASPDVPTRRSAAYVLKKVAVEGRDALIDKLLADPVYSVRKMALRAVLALDTDVGIERIGRLLADENPWVRKEAIECAGRVAEFPTDAIVSRFAAEQAAPVEAAMCGFFVARHLDPTVPMIVAKVKRQPEDEQLAMFLETLGRLNAREAIADMRKQLANAGPIVATPLAIAGLLQGELSVLDDLVTRCQTLTRPDPLRDTLNVAGAVGQFLRVTEQFSPALTKVLMEAAMIDMDPNLLLGVPKAGGPPKVDAAEFPRGVDLYNQGQFEQAVEFFVRFTEALPTHVDAQYMLGAALLKVGKLPEAKDRLEKLLTAKPDHVNGGMLLGQLYFQRKEFKRLIDLYERLKTIVPATDKRLQGQIHAALGLSRFHQKDFTGAIDALKKAASANAKDLGSVYHLALSFYAVKDFKNAMLLLKRLTKELPPKSQVLRNVEELIQKLEDEG